MIDVVGLVIVLVILFLMYVVLHSRIRVYMFNRRFEATTRRIKGVRSRCHECKEYNETAARDRIEELTRAYITYKDKFAAEDIKVKSLGMENQLLRYELSRVVDDVKYLNNLLQRSHDAV